ncbi:putative protein kinase [Trypanosoma cruzi]|nr:putative Repressor of differentiation kinase 1 [Trypanosoma cruzi]PWV12004.1 putative protein kinase [Trypanosoma cruzi]
MSITGPTKVRIGEATERKCEEDVDASFPKENETWRVWTMLVIAGVMSFGVVIVGAFGFFPIYFVSFSAAERATRLVHLQSINVVRSATKSSALHLPTFINTISANYAISLKNRKNFFPEDKQKLLFALANVMSKRTYRDAVGRLLVVSAGPPGEEWGALAVSFSETRQIGGCVMHGMNSSNLYEIDPERANFTVPPHPLGPNAVSLVRTLSQKDGPYESIVLPWNQSKIQGVQWNKYWLTAGIGYSFMYFDYVLPFITDKGLGFWEIAMRTSVFNHGALGLLTRTLRDNGRFMLFDSTIEFVVLNSWGQPTIKKETKGTYSIARVLRLDSISDPLMKATVKRMRQHGDPEAFLKGSDRGELSFLYNKDEVYARLLRLKDGSGLNVFMLISTLHADFFRAIYQSSTHVGLATGISVMVVAIFAVIIAYFLVRPLRRLVPELKRASQLQLRGQNDKSDVWKRSRIAEVRDIQNAYAELTRQLRIVKTFVPSAILAAPSTSTSSNSFNSRDQLCHRKARGHHLHATFPLRDGPISTRAELEAMEENNFAKLRQEMRLNSRVFKEQTNKFVRRYCTVVLIENARPFSLDAYFHNILTCAAEQNGCVEYSRPDRTLVSFGAHSPLPMHSIKGCRFALELFAKLAPQEREAITLFIDTNEFHVGTCGAHSKNARVVVGVMNLRELAKVANRLGCRIAVTAGTSSQLQGHQVYPIECVLPSSSTESVVLSELRPQTALRKTMVGTAKHFRLGFSAMRQGNYKQAISHFQRVEKSDPQAQRLIRLCAQRRSQNDNKSYVRLAIEILQEKLPDVNVTAADDAVVMNSVGCSQDACGKIGLNKSEVFSIQSKASPKRKGCESEGGALFEMINFSNSSSSESFQALEDGCNSADDLPLLLTDMNHRVWTRSLKKISEGAFSAVFLGMSEDGGQVAIKCIPRRRRDIMQESLEAEMNVASKLRHPNIVQYVSCSVVQSHLAIIMEYVPGGSLHAVIKNFGRMSSLVARRFTVDILNGLSYLHGLGIVHCDVKPHNMLLGMDGVCKLSDFGSTISEAADMARTMADEVMLRGTALYMAPEVAAGGRCTSQSDIFSLGISLLEMLLGRLPWKWSSKAPEGSDATSLQALFNRDLLFVQSLARDYLEPEIPDFLDFEVAHFVRSCCHPNPAMRPSASALLSYSFVL